MAQIFLLLMVLVAALVLLINAWRTEKRLFAVTALVVAVTAGVMTSVLTLQLLSPADELEPEQITITLHEARPSENGVRFSGHIQNHSDRRINALSLRAQALICIAEECKVEREDTVELLIHIPAKAGYPFSVVSRLMDLQGRTDLQWQLEAVRITTY
ncbi:MAG: hypothetical protein CVV10_02825 [Gammaproteobacteria bacterium HGW-Gammaproteobacteria-14]|nr:MAG: hypothetical protein CVV10_02825 [Gammaproteobacteria bacterium HGW-Gammaproteobacteria-14]